MDENLNEQIARIYLMRCLIANRLTQQVIDRAYGTSHGKPRKFNPSQYQSGYVQMNFHRVMIRRAYEEDVDLEQFSWNSKNYVVINCDQFLIQDTWDVKSYTLKGKS